MKKCLLVAVGLACAAVGSGCATALVNEYQLRGAQHRRSAIMAMVNASDGEADVLIGVDVTRLGQVREAPLAHGVAALIDGAVMYFAYDEWGRSDRSGGTGFPEGSFALIEGSGNETTLTQGAAPSSFIVRGDRNRLTVEGSR